MNGYVNNDLCVGCGACVATCPEGFRMGDDGLAEGYQDIPAEAKDNATEAAENCPVAAIELK